VEETNQCTGIVRLLLADNNEVNTFVLQCAINRLSRPCAFQRLSRGDLLAEKIESFRPHFLVVAGSFAAPTELKQLKALTNGHPIICLVETAKEGDACLGAGATDCVLFSQQHQLGDCLDKHLTGQFKTPHFQAGRTAAPERKNTPLKERLDEFDRQIGALLRRCWVRTKARLGGLRQKAGTAQTRARKWIALRTKEWKEKRKLRVQAEDTDSPASEIMEPIRVRYSIGQNHELWNDPETMVRRNGPAPVQEFSPKVTDRNSNEASETLRAMELSFKTLFHTALDPMFLVDGMGAFLYVNSAGCALFGQTTAEILGKSLLDFVPVTERSEISALWESVLVEGQQKMECKIRSERDGREIVREVLLSARANLWFGVHLVVIKDETELKSLRREAATKPQPAPSVPV
jgi:PAS domain S-box-containing protein